MKIFSWIRFGLFVLSIGWQLWQEFNPYIYAWSRKIGGVTIADYQIQTRELSIQSMLTKAQELYQQGDNCEACRFLY